MVKGRILFLSLTLLFGIILMARPATADMITTCFPNSTTDCQVTNSGNIEVVAGNSGINTVTLSAVGGDLEAGDTVVFTGGVFSGPPLVGCISGLPSGAGCNFNPTQVAPVPTSTGSESSTLTVTTSSTTPPGNYLVTVEVGFVSGGEEIIAPAFSIQQLHPEQAFEVFTTQFHLIVDPVPPIPEYPIGLPILAIFMILGYGLLKRRTGVKKLP